MGLFLKRKKKTSRGRKKSKRSAAPKPWDPQRTMLGLKLLAAAVGALTLWLTWSYTEGRLVDYVGQRAAAKVSPQSVELDGAPGWMSRMLRRDLQELVSRQMVDDPLNPVGLDHAAAALEANPWIAAVHAVRREPDGRVIVEADYREPMALVESRNGYLLIDTEGVRLQGLYLAHQVKEVGLPVIVGVSGQAPQPGRKWSDASVLSTLSLVRMLRHEPYADQIAAFDAGHRDSRGRLRLVMHTHTGGLVRWGLPPGDEQAIEPEAAIKKRWLQSVYRQRGKIDAGGKVVDLYGAAVFVHQNGLQGNSRRVGYHW